MACSQAEGRWEEGVQIYFEHILRGVIWGGGQKFNFPSVMGRGDFFSCVFSRWGGSPIDFAKPSPSPPPPLPYVLCRYELFHTLPAPAHPSSLPRYTCRDHVLASHSAELVPYSRAHCREIIHVCYCASLSAMFNFSYLTTNVTAVL